MTGCAAQARLLFATELTELGGAGWRSDVPEKASGGLRSDGAVLGLPVCPRDTTG